ncbi:TetR/AcrR family transcriptional regulator [Novosphingobium flavum]|uniref:TetR/AcrR family transcriptional regulator n=1 Tax=Novosphingobium flavum TaxID=1778672 RepID=A0A7X1FUX2_9SPHN|nr:TetR/AcrR family transcriptional regulator [Novosphingobium flavum]MBC2667433.1 TetR/AcrR family transcriptional regulator [Novosphingobium flavum]
MQCSSPTKPTGRREARKEERRDAILDVAAQSFLEHGYAGTTMSGIAGTLGGSKGTLWSYFPSKELLFAAVLDRATRAFREEIEVTLNESEDIAPALRTICESLIGKMSSPHGVGLHRLVMGEAKRFPEMGRIFYESAPERTLKILAAHFEKAMASGILAPADPFHAAQYLTSLCTARSHMRLLTGVLDGLSPDEVREQAHRAVELFLRAFAPAD